MPELQASRRLVKSPPELWAEVSDAASLARHLGELGEIRITRLEPETTVAWEGVSASGTVELAPAGWGTAVTLTASAVATEPSPELVEPEPEPAQPLLAPEPEPEPTRPPRRSWLAALLGRRAREAPAEPAATEPPQTPSRDPDPVQDPLLATLTSALDSLGSAHHRPFSRG
jgi:hypothetical protein